MIRSYFPKCVTLFALFVLSVGALDTFIAAVYEHAVILPNSTETPVSKEEALLLMNKNIDVLEEAVKLAAKQGAHIIVTPEDGIYGWVFTRESIYPYLEDIPDPEVNWIPCREPQRNSKKMNESVSKELYCHYHCSQYGEWKLHRTW
uniref:Vanin 3 n=1 Tax=Prolemur simus TaxID=1328070 RepID=A0A8C8Z3R8_PROSS